MRFIDRIKQRAKKEKKTIVLRRVRTDVLLWRPRKS